MKGNNPFFSLYLFVAISLLDSLGGSLPNALRILFASCLIIGLTTLNINGVAAAAPVAITAIAVVVLTSAGEGRYSSTQVVDCSSVEITSLSLVVFGISGIGGVSRGGCSVFAVSYTHLTLPTTPYV